MRIQTALVLAQAATFLPLSAIFISQGDWRLGVAQLFLFGVTVLIYL